MKNNNQKFTINFKLVVIGQIISLFGSSILRFALSFFILDITGSATTFGLIMGISTIPSIILAPIGGAIADRINKKNLMVIFDFTSSFLVLILAIFMFNNQKSLIIIGIIMTLLSVISIMYQPVVQASVPILVEDEYLMKANGIVSSVQAISNFVGPIVGGVLNSYISIEIIVIISCISFFLSAIMEIFIHITFIKSEMSSGIIKTISLDIKQGLEYVKKDSLIKKLLLITPFLNLFLTPIFVVGIPYVVNIVFSAGSEYFGFTQGGLSLSMVIGGATVGLFAKKLSKEKLYFFLAILGLLFLPMAFSVYSPVKLGNTMFLVQYLIFTLSGMVIMYFTTILNIFVFTLFQKETPSELLGKVMAIVIAVSTIATPIGQMVYGWLLDIFASQVYILIIITGVVTLVLSFIAKQLKLE